MRVRVFQVASMLALSFCGTLGGCVQKASVRRSVSAKETPETKSTASNPAPVLPKLEGAQTRTIGAWVARQDYNSDSIKKLVADAKSMGLNTIYPAVWSLGCTLFPSEVLQRAGAVAECSGERTANWFQELFDVAKAEGIETVPWFEFGFKVPNPSALYTLALQKGWIIEEVPAINEMGSRYLDVSRDDVLQLFLDMQQEFLTRYPQVNAIQWDDHVGIDVTKIADAEKSKYQAVVTRFATRMREGAKSIKPTLIVEMSPNPEGWARDVYAARWRDWNYDRVFVQAFVPKNFSLELQKVRTIAAGMGVLIGFGTEHPTDAQVQEILSKQIALVPQNMGVIFFHFDSFLPSQYTLLHSFFEQRR